MNLLLLSNQKSTLIGYKDLNIKEFLKLGFSFESNEITYDKNVPFTLEEIAKFLISNKNKNNFTTRGWKKDKMYLLNDFYLQCISKDKNKKTLESKIKDIGNIKDPIEKELLEKYKETEKIVEKNLDKVIKNNYEYESKSKNILINTLHYLWFYEWKSIKENSKISLPLIYIAILLRITIEIITHLLFSNNDDLRNDAIDTLEKMREESIICKNFRCFYCLTYNKDDIFNDTKEILKAENEKEYMDILLKNKRIEVFLIFKKIIRKRKDKHFHELMENLLDKISHNNSKKEDIQRNSDFLQPLVNLYKNDSENLNRVIHAPYLIIDMENQKKEDVLSLFEMFSYLICTFFAKNI